jgi:hypothetical protein
VAAEGGAGVDLALELLATCGRALIAGHEGERPVTGR